MAERNHDNDQDRWHEYEKLILAELSRLNGTLEAMRQDLSEFKVSQAITIGNLYAEVAGIRVKSSIFGAVAGAITVMSVVLTYYIRNVVK